MWPGMHLAHNSAKLKIFNLPKHYPVVKVRPLGLDGTLAAPAPSDPLVGGAIPTDQRSDVGPDTKTTARSRRAAVSTALALELVGALRPVIQFLSGASEVAECPPCASGWWRRGDSNS